MPAAQISQGAMTIAAGATTTQTSADFVNVAARGVKVWVVTTVIGTASLTLSIQGKDPGSGTYVTLLAGAAISTNTTNTYSIYPGAAVTANVSANDALPYIWRLVVTAGNANAATYSVGFSTLA